jgi:hypothetical protein
LSTASLAALSECPVFGPDLLFHIAMPTPGPCRIAHLTPRHAKASDRVRLLFSYGSYSFAPEAGAVDAAAEAESPGSADVPDAAVLVSDTESETATGADAADASLAGPSTGSSSASLHAVSAMTVIKDTAKKRFLMFRSFCIKVYLTSQKISVACACSFNS